MTGAPDPMERSAPHPPQTAGRLNGCARLANSVAQRVISTGVPSTVSYCANNWKSHSAQGTLTAPFLPPPLDFSRHFNPTVLRRFAQDCCRVCDLAIHFYRPMPE